jgi:integrase/recombinase XerC
MSECLLLGKRPTSVNRSRDALSSLYQALTVSGDVRENPVVNIRAIKCHPSPRTYLDAHHATLFIESIKDPLLQLDARVMYYTGIRISELTTLAVCHIDLDNQTLSVIGKGRKDRRIPLHDTELVPYLKEHKDRELQDADEYALFFGTRRTGRIAPSTVNKSFRKASQRLGTSVIVTSHMFRHSFATRYLYAGGQIHELQYLLGHNHIETTAKYLHVKMDAIRFTIQKKGAIPVMN